MSRCFPFPPPGYVGSKASNDALIESIKLQRESEIAKAERKKEKKREKKEKRERKDKEKEKKDKLKQYLDGAQDRKTHKSAPDGEAHRSCDSKGTFKEKTRAEIEEQMERSGLTEEHKKPVSVHKPSYSSDSTENSNKRKRPASPAPSLNGGITGHGNVIRIRLPLGNRKKPKLDNEENICSTSGRTELTTPLQKNPPIQKQLPIIENKKPFCSTSGADKLFTPVDVPKPSVLAPFEKKLQAASFLYKELVDKIPSTIPNESIDLDDDQEWLFSRKKQDNRRVEKTDKQISDLSCRGSSLLQPCAQFLPDVGIYALPYTLPF